MSKSTLTDDLLRDEIGAGLKPPEIAQKYGISKQGVYKRINRLTFTTTAVAVVAPPESRRFVNSQVDAMEELSRSLARVNLLMDACDDWLRDPNDLSRYDIGARGSEVNVTYLTVEPRGEFFTTVRHKATLQELLARVDGSDLKAAAADRRHFDVERSEIKFSDPRELILKTAQEVRQTVQAATELARLLADARAMQVFREALLLEIGKVSPTVAQAISESVRRVLVLHAATGGP